MGLLDYNTEKPEQNLPVRDEQSQRYLDAGRAIVAERVAGYEHPDILTSSITDDDYIEMGRESLKEREGGFLKGVVRDIASGIPALGKLAGHAIKTIDPEGGIDVVDRFGQKIIDVSGRMAETGIMRPREAMDEGFVERGIRGGLQSTVPSLGPMFAGAGAGAAVGSVVPGIGTVIGGIIGGAAATLGIHGLGVYGQKKEEYLQQGIDEKTAHKAAVQQGLVEGGIETVSNIVGMLTFGWGKLASQPLKQTAKELLKTPVKTFAKNLTKNALLNEVPTEMLQGALGAKIDERIGLLPEGAWQEAAVESIIPALTMSILFGLGAQGATSLQRNHVKKQLNSANPEERVKATEYIAKNIDDKELRQAWINHVTPLINEGASIDINADFTQVISGEVDQVKADIKSGLIPEGIKSGDLALEDMAPVIERVATQDPALAKQITDMFAIKETDLAENERRFKEDPLDAENNAEYLDKYIKRAALPEAEPIIPEPEVKPIPIEPTAEVAREPIGVETIAKETGATYKGEAEGLHYWDVDVGRETPTTIATEKIDVKELQKKIVDTKEAFAVEKPVKEVAPEKKESWEMTKAEYLTEGWYKGIRVDHPLWKRDAEGRPATTEHKEEIAIEHMNNIRNALKEGKPVPESILAEYPELAPAKPLPPKPPEAKLPEAVREPIEVEGIVKPTPKTWESEFNETYKKSEFSEPERWDEFKAFSKKYYSEAVPISEHFEVWTREVKSKVEKVPVEKKEPKVEPSAEVKKWLAEQAEKEPTHEVEARSLFVTRVRQFADLTDEQTQDLFLRDEFVETIMPRIDEAFRKGAGNKEITAEAKKVAIEVRERLGKKPVEEIPTIKETKDRLIKNIKDEKGESVLITDLSTLGADVIRRGHESFKAFSAQMKTTLSEVWDKIKHLMQKAYDAAKIVIASERGIIAGVGAKYAPKSALVKTREMLAKGVDKKVVWQKTGWLKGIEGKWKFEIDDSGAKWKPGFIANIKTRLRKTLKLKDVFIHPALYKAYPGSKDVRLKIEKLPHGDNGTYNAGINTIKINSTQAVDIEYEGDVQYATRNILLHEIQHYIQSVEGFARGGTPFPTFFFSDMVKKENLKYLKTEGLKKAKQRINDAKGQPEYEAMRAEYDILKRTIKEIERDPEVLEPYEVYLRLAGEIEARDVAARAKLTPEQRREQIPYEAEGIPREDWIITKGKGTNFSVEPSERGEIVLRERKEPTPEYTEMLKRYQGAHTTPLIDEAIDETKIKHFPSLEKKGTQPVWIKEKFGRTEKTLTDKIGDNVGAFRKNWQTRLLDKLHPIKALGETAYMLHRLETGSQATMSMFMRHGKLRWKGKALTVDTQKQGFMPWLDSLGDDAQKLFYWMAAKRAEVLETEGREKWLGSDTRKNIYDWVGDKPKSAKSWKVLNDQFQEFNKSVLDLAQQSGLINAGRRAAWEQEFYVPFYRIFEDGIAKEEFLKGPLMSKKHISTQIKRLTGAEMKIGDPLENIIRNWSHLIHESVRNTARAEAYNFAQKNNMKAGITDDSGNLLPLIETVKASDLNIYRSDKEKRMVYVTKKGDDNILSFQKNGHKVYFKVNDAELFNALSDVNHRQFNGFLIRAFGHAKRWLTYGATFGPAFKVANMLRDTLHTAIISKSFIPFIDSGKGIVKALKEDADYVKFMASGAGFGSSYIRAENPKALAEYINRIVKKEGEGAARRILDTPKKMLDFWEKLGAASENAARVQLYTKRIAEGETHLKAAFEGRDLMDFTMRGDSQVVQYLIRTVPFMNARAQGLYKLGRAAKQDPKSFMIKGSILTIATFALWAMNRDKDEWKELEDWDKRTYYHFWIGDKHYRIPKPFETGAIFSTMFEGMAETMAGDEEFGYFVDVMKDTFLDTFAMNPLPQAIRPLIEQWSNKSFFTGRPIEGQSLQRLRPGERKTAWTSETMQLAGKLGVSPKRAEEIIRGYFSTFGMFLLGTSDIFAYHLADFPTNPTKEINDYPLLGRFIKERVPARHTKYQTKFYEMFREVDQLVATVNNHRRLGNYKEAAILATKERKAFIKRKGLLKVRKELTEINANLRRTMASRILTAEQKRTKIDGLIERKNQATQQIYERYLEQ